MHITCVKDAAALITLSKLKMILETGLRSHYNLIMNLLNYLGKERLTLDVLRKTFSKQYANTFIDTLKYESLYLTQYFFLHIFNSVCFNNIFC